MSLLKIVDRKTELILIRIKLKVQINKKSKIASYYNGVKINKNVPYNLQSESVITFCTGLLYILLKFILIVWIFFQHLFTFWIVFNKPSKKCCTINHIRVHFLFSIFENLFRIIHIENLY